MKKGLVVAAVLGVVFAAASPPRHNDPAASAPAHSVPAPAAQTASKTDPASGGPSQSHPQVATDQAISLNTTLPSSAPQTFGWLIVLACTIALLVAMATVVLTVAALRG